jgi:hypothetical protein
VLFSSVVFEDVLLLLDHKALVLYTFYRFSEDLGGIV